MKVATLCRWTGRLAATAITGLLIAFLVGEGTPEVRELSDSELLGFGALFLMVLGTLVGWVRDLAGGLLLLAGYGAFALVEHGWPPLPFAVFFAAGLLLTASGILRRFRPASKPAATAPDPANKPAD
jgi:hypothetical protein